MKWYVVRVCTFAGRCHLFQKYNIHTYLCICILYFTISCCLFPLPQSERECVCVSLHRSVLLRLCCALLCCAVLCSALLCCVLYCTVLCTVLYIVVFVCVSFFACSLYSWDFSNDSNVSLALSKRLFGSPSGIAREKLGLGK